MIDIRVAGLDKLHIFGSNIPLIAKRALNRTAQAVQFNLREEMKRVFDRPTPFTLRAFYLDPATTSKQYAKVWLKDLSAVPGEHYLVPEIYGGNRKPKRYEETLRRSGNLPENMFTVPGKGARINNYGNMSMGQIMQVLAVTHSLSDRYSWSSPNSRKRNRTLPDYFVIKDKDHKLPMGIYQRKGGDKIVSVLLFVKQPTYRPRLSFDRIVNTTVSDNWDKLFNEEIKRGLQQGKG